MSEPWSTGDGAAGGGPTRPLPVMEKSDGPDPGGAAEHRPAAPDAVARGHRFWSARRIPAGIVALLLLAAAGLFLYDVAAVRAGRPTMWWRRNLAQQLAEKPLDDTGVLVGAGVAAALGLWLLLLALTPGLRRLLPMVRTDADVRAGLHRDAAATVLRDRAMEVAGVQKVRVKLRRRRADVRALAHFRELDDVRGDLDLTIADAVDGLGLSHPPKARVRVARPGRKG
ncbi:DUF6286 domain-containing protein [Streptomyces sp. NPDC090306]|uniref:DUF6286 domain-containing protein n=1 Tax=unclassified Streptomyces TaxID=2593676 RepID=UPI0036E3F636